VRAGVKENPGRLEDTSAIWRGLKYAAQVWRDKERRAHFYDLTAALANSRVDSPATMSIHIRTWTKSSEHGEGGVLPFSTFPLPARPARDSQAHEAAGRGRGHAAADRGVAQSSTRHHDSSTFIVGFSGAKPRRTSKSCSSGFRLRNWTASAVSSIPPSRAPREFVAPPEIAAAVKQSGVRVSWNSAAQISAGALPKKVGRKMQVLVDRMEDGVPIARSSSDAPEILTDRENRPRRGQTDAVATGDGHDHRGGSLRSRGHFELLDPAPIV